MNERIKEIWGKAWNAYIGPDGILDGKDADDFYEKFAELIVRECANQLDDGAEDGMWARSVLYKNFGVKE